ncbi:ABC transporter family substrate-binding protein [Actinomyces radicidentis]|uniref:ABC transporter family substrate-binding protein n=1 Tax=Actinomyces radicidentis TaxID=111015 RepID=UPI0028EBE940|nr:ABC transporter family substrate-binding protein [Actinomyces radicidentis]
MMITRRLFLGGSASVAALAALAACGSGSSSGSDASATPVKLAASAINKQDRSKLTQGGELRIPLSSMVPNYNPLHIDGGTTDNAAIQDFAGIHNFVYADDGTFTAREEFCKDFKDEEKDGKTVVTMHLNPEAKWNSGDAITYADYQGCWKACNGSDDAFTSVVSSTDGWDHIESIEQGSDEYEMVVTFNSVFPDWSAVLSGTIVPAKLTESPEAFSSWTDASDTSSWAGPFIVTSADSTKQTVVLEPNDAWWGEKPLLDKVTFKVVDSSATGTAFANKELDVVDTIIDASTYQQCQQRSDGEIRQAAGLQWRHFTMNGASGLLADQKLRQAIVKGIDRETITEADLQGLPVPASQLQLGNHLFAPQDADYQDNTGDLAFNKEQAVKDLESLGWTLPDGKEYREKDGQTLSIKYLRLPDVATSATEGKVLQANMKAIGVEIVMDDTNNDDFLPERIKKGNFEIVSFAWQGTPYPMANIGQVYGKGSASNYTGLSSDALEKLIDEVAVEADHKKRVELAQDADKEIWKLAGVIPIYSRAAYTAVPKKLANYGSFGLSSVRPEDIGYTK